MVAQRWHYLLRDQPHAGAPRLGRYRAVVLPEREDTRPQYVEDVLEPWYYRLRGTDYHLTVLLRALVAGVDRLFQRLDIDRAFERLEQRGTVGIVRVAELPRHPPRRILGEISRREHPLAAREMREPAAVEVHFAQLLRLLLGLCHEDLLQVT